MGKALCFPHGMGMSLGPRVLAPLAYLGSLVLRG